MKNMSECNDLDKHLGHYILRSDRDDQVETGSQRHTTHSLAIGSQRYIWKPTLRTALIQYQYNN